MRRKQFTLMLSEEERLKMLRLGGGPWVRAQIEKAQLPEWKATGWKSIEERNAAIASDIRPAKVVGRLYDISPESVYEIRAKAKRRGIIANVDRRTLRGPDHDHRRSYQIR